MTSWSIVAVWCRNLQQFVEQHLTTFQFCSTLLLHRPMEANMFHSVCLWKKI